MISVITCWPDSFDFPLFREHMSDLLGEVNEVVICFTSHGNHSISDWIKANLKNVQFTTETDEYHNQDWRSRATNRMLDMIKGDWVLSLEQDFLITDYPLFFSKVKAAMADHDVITFTENDRYHPAFLLVRTELLKRTKRDFSAMGTGRDHFHQITKELKALEAQMVTLEQLGLTNPEDWYHYQGMTDNYFAPKPYFKLPEFYQYNQACKVIEPMSDYWRGEMERCSQ
jgi:hypothetical protein